MPRTFDEETRGRAEALHAEGKGCNAIARELGVAASTISAWAKGAGLTFDRSQTETAVRARTIDLADARTLLAQKMVVAASDLLDTLDGPYLVYNFGGKDNTYQEHLLDSAPVDVVRSAVTTAGIAFDKVTRIVERDGGGFESAAGVLDQVAGALSAAAEVLREGDSADAGAE